ncbi:MAG: response regulator transcription factor [Anaerolineales bacterium]|nr:response regulator transcription factor [Anaerolineales bacterium]
MAKIMLIDDERSTADLLKMFLELDGFSVVTCPTLEAARSQITADLQALVIDRNLAREVVGTQLLIEIRAGQTLLPTDIPVIITSGDDRREQEALEAGATKFLLKPFSPGELSADLQALIQ